MGAPASQSPQSSNRRCSPGHCTTRVAVISTPTTRRGGFSAHTMDLRVQWTDVSPCRDLWLQTCALHVSPPERAHRHPGPFSFSTPCFRPTPKGWVCGATYKQQVLRLDVAVDDTLGVAVVQRVGQLPNVLRRPVSPHRPHRHTHERIEATCLLSVYALRV